MMNKSALPATRQALQALSCAPASGPALEAQSTAQLLALLEGWQLDKGALLKRWRFADFHQTMAFANAVAWIAHGQDHHPDMDLRYSSCELRWSTHSVDGLSINDFICAARVDALQGP